MPVSRNCIKVRKELRGTHQKQIQRFCEKETEKGCGFVIGARSVPEYISGGVALPAYVVANLMRLKQ